MTLREAVVDYNSALRKLRESVEEELKKDGEWDDEKGNHFSVKSGKLRIRYADKMGSSTGGRVDNLEMQAQCLLTRPA